jgi:hypothetical protein
VPVSTPGRCRAHLTATLCITKDPTPGRNMGTYRAQLKASDRLRGADGIAHRRLRRSPHWLKYRDRGQPMPCAIVLGCARRGVHRAAEARHRPGRDGRRRRACGLAIRTAKAVTIDVEVPADAEIVIEGLIDPDLLDRKAVRRARLYRARRLQHVDAGDRDHAPARAGVRVDREPGDAERVGVIKQVARADVPHCICATRCPSRTSAGWCCTSRSPTSAR